MAKCPRAQKTQRPVGGLELTLKYLTHNWRDVMHNLYREGC